MSLALPSKPLAAIYLDRLRPTLCVAIKANLRGSASESLTIIEIETRGKEMRVVLQERNTGLVLDPRTNPEQIPSCAGFDPDLLDRYIDRAEGVLRKLLPKILRNIEELIDGYSVATIVIQFRHGLVEKLVWGIESNFETSQHPDIKRIPLA